MSTKLRIASKLQSNQSPVEVNSWIKKSLLNILIIPSLLFASPLTSQAANVPVYFGVGCFWHVQHEFVESEKKILGRTNTEFTSTAGYAGGSRTDKVKSGDGVKELVCYHNLLGIADYGSLGHGEVVNLVIPEEKINEFSNQYFSLFGNDLERPDKGDRGPEYRSLIGLPGGMKSPLFPAVQAAAERKGLRLQAGNGNDADTLGKKLVWVMDSEKFPFYQAEIYHQFHDGFMPGEGYPQSYNSLSKEAYMDGRIKLTGCPDTPPN